jgi:hypothetical protein
MARAVGLLAAAGLASLPVAGCTLDGFSGGEPCPPCACGGWTESQVSAGPDLAPVIAWTGSAWAIAYEDGNEATSAIGFALVAPGGGLVAEPIVVSNAGSDAYAPAVAAIPVEAAIAFETYGAVDNAVELARVDAMGAKMGNASVVRTNPDFPESAALAYDPDDDELGMVWDEATADGTVIRFGRIGADGMLIATPTTASSSTAQAGFSTLSWRGGGYGAGWEDFGNVSSTIFFAAIDPAGTAAAPREVSDGTGNAFDVSLAWTGSGYGASWWDDRNGSSEIYFAALDASGVKAGADVRLTTAGGESSLPSLAWSGAAMGVAFDDDRGGSLGIWFLLVDPAGTPIAPEFEVAGANGTAGHAALGWSGTSWGLAWEDSRGGEDGIWFATCTP